MRRIDIGCGQSKAEGFVGVDRYPLPDVDVVADLDGNIPFEDSSVDLIFASHSLEHVGDLIFTMRELYRICKHNAQVCIVAPYNEQKLNVANPYHKHVFNEHTPRFWTDCPTAPIDPEDYFHPHATMWGLSQTDYSEKVMDFRIVRMEFFYFPEYECLDAREQRKMRSQRWDVCDQIMYHLIAWKDEAASNPMHVAPAQELYVPRFIQIRREEVERKKAGLAIPCHEISEFENSSPAII